MAYAPPRLGHTKSLRGNVTTLNWIGARPARDIEVGLGFGPGRLAQGYWVLLLKEPLQPGDFEFDGTTLRSGGRLGLPAATDAFDRLRPRMHDEMMSARGAADYAALQARVLAQTRYGGPERIAKVLPVTGHDATMAPSAQYPMGGGGLQWKLVNDKRFLVALQVDAHDLARTPVFSVSLAAGQPFQQLYDNRAKVARYLASA